MNSIDWSKAPEGATEIVTDVPPRALRWAKKSHVWSFVNEQWKFRHESWVTIATREQEPHFKATRENLEKIAKDAKGDFVEFGEQESEPEWTHVSSGGNLCRFLMKTVHGDLYENKFGIKFISGFEGCNSVKPIKPKITKAEAWDLCQDYGGKLSIREYMRELNEKYEVVE